MNLVRAQILCMNEFMAAQRKHRLTCEIHRDTIEKLDEMVEEDRRFWNRTHLINEALVAYIAQWESDQEGDPVVDASEEVDDDDDGEEESHAEDEGQGDLFDPNVPFPAYEPSDDDDDEDEDDDDEE